MAQIELSEEEVASALRASTSAVRQTDRLRGAAHPVVNIRTSRPLAPTLECSDVRLVGQEARERVLELRCPVTVPREIGSLSRMNDDRVLRGRRLFSILAIFEAKLTADLVSELAMGPSEASKVARCAGAGWHAPDDWKRKVVEAIERSAHVDCV